MIHPTELNSWLEEILLGYGDFDSDDYHEFKARELKKDIDFFDTFIDFNHFQDAYLSNPSIHKSGSEDMIPSILQLSEQNSKKKIFPDVTMELYIPHKKGQNRKYGFKKKTNSVPFTGR
jgi:hypothetical protein